MESMLGGLERDCVAGKHRVHLREDTGVTPNLFHIKPLYLINKQTSNNNKNNNNHQKKAVQLNKDFTRIRTERSRFILQSETRSNS